MSGISLLLRGSACWLGAFNVLGLAESIAVPPVLTTPKRWIVAYHQEELIYVLPSYDVKESGTLMLDLIRYPTYY